MNVGDIKTRVLRTFGDDANVQITEADIFRWINDGMQHIVSQNETLLRTVSSPVNLVANDDTYSLPADCHRLQAVRIKRYTTDNSYYTLGYVTSQELDEYVSGWDGTDISADVPTSYTKDTNTSIRLFPVPSTSITNGLKFYYTKYPTDITTTTDTPELPLEYHNALVSYCLWQAYLLDDDVNGAQHMEQLLGTIVNSQSEQENWPSVDYYKTITVREEDL